MNEQCSHPNQSLTLQWHITSRCNQRCTHCYQTSYSSEELDFTSFKEIVAQYKELLSTVKRRGHINVTGGEPFIRDDFFDLLELFHQNEKFFSFAILTNGSLIDKKAAETLKRLKTSFVQLSVEGTKEIHDSIRGTGNLELVLSKIKLLSGYGIKTLVSFTAHQDNYRSFPDVVRMCRKNGAFKVWTDRVVPFGTGQEFKDKSLSSSQALEYFNIVYQCKPKSFLGFGSKTKVELNRALQFLVEGNVPYRCKAGEALITVMEDGTVLPCRRLPITAGNIKNMSLMEIYQKSDILKELRSYRQPEEGCSKCSYYPFCRGGARCISYALTGEVFAKDPGCPMFTKI